MSKEQRRAYRAQLAKYEAKGSSFGQSVAGMMYLLAEGLGRADIDSVWCVDRPLQAVLPGERRLTLPLSSSSSSRRLAILGLTHQLTNSLIDLSAYESLQSLYATEVARLSSSAAALEAGNVSTSHASTSERDRSIRPSDELRFCLFRHWNLYDAMFHSGYLGGRMKLWTVEGRKKLSGLLAKMGCVLPLPGFPLARSSSTRAAS